MSKSTRDPRREGIKSAILTRLNDRLKDALDAAEPGVTNWRQHQTRAALLRELISEFEGLQDV